MRHHPSEHVSRSWVVSLWFIKHINDVRQLVIDQSLLGIDHRRSVKLTSEVDRSHMHVALNPASIGPRYLPYDGHFASHGNDVHVIYIARADDVYGSDDVEYSLVQPRDMMQWNNCLPLQVRMFVRTRNRSSARKDELFELHNEHVIRRPAKLHNTVTGGGGQGK